MYSLKKYRSYNQLLRVLIVSSISILSACTKHSYFDLPANSLCIFDVGDTLIYASEQKCDTFLVKYRTLGYEVWDSRTHKQSFHINFIEITDSCRDAESFNCHGFLISRLGTTNDFFIGFRNINDWISTDSGSISLQLGNKVIDDVYSEEYSEPANKKVRDVRKIYYTHKYGLVAYELFTGELFDLDERYIE